MVSERLPTAGHRKASRHHTAPGWHTHHLFPPRSGNGSRSLPRRRAAPPPQVFFTKSRHAPEHLAPEGHSPQCVCLPWHTQLQSSLSGPRLSLQEGPLGALSLADPMASAPSIQAVQPLGGQFRSWVSSL